MVKFQLERKKGTEKDAKTLRDHCPAKGVVVEGKVQLSGRKSKRKDAPKRFTSVKREQEGRTRDEHIQPGRTRGRQTFARILPP